MAKDTEEATESIVAGVVVNDHIGNGKGYGGGYRKYSGWRRRK